MQTPGDGDLRHAVVGQECHIVARSATGPRGTDGERDDLDGYTNLILLCATCHALVDSQPGTYTLDVLRRLKAKHERAQDVDRVAGHNLLAQAERAGRFKRLSHLNAREFGVEWAGVDVATDGHLPYCPNLDIEVLVPMLQEALASRVFEPLVVTGDSGRGKTRLVFEALRRVWTADEDRQSCWVFTPGPADGPLLRSPALFEAVEDQAIVIWMDDVETVFTPSAVALSVDDINTFGELADSHTAVVIATAGGKGRQVYEEALRRLHPGGLQLDRFLRRSREVVMSGTVDPEAASSMFGENAADQIARHGLGVWALRANVLRDIYVNRRWPSTSARPTSSGLDDAVALVDALVAWKVAVSDSPVPEQLARELWSVFRPRRDAIGFPTDAAWQNAVEWATTPALPRQPLVRIDGDEHLEANDLIIEVAPIPTLLDHLAQTPSFDMWLKAQPDAALTIGMRSHTWSSVAARKAYTRALTVADQQVVVAASCNLGVLLEETDREEARRVLEAAIEQGSDAARVNLAGMISDEETEPALALLRVASLSDDPHISSRAAFMLGDLMVDVDHREARAAYEQAMETAPDDVGFRAACALGSLLHTRDPAAALEAYSHARTADDEHTAAKGAYGVGMLLVETDPNAARDALLEAYASDDDDMSPRALLVLASYFGDYLPDGGRAFYQAAIASRHPDVAGPAALNLGAMLIGSDPSAARQALELAVAIGDVDQVRPMAAFNLGVLLIDEDRPAAVRALETAANSEHEEIPDEARSLLDTIASTPADVMLRE